MDKAKTQLSEQQLRVIDQVITKYTLLVVVSSFGVLIVAALWRTRVYIISYCVFAFVTVLCLTLQFHFSDDYYDKMCGFCHDNCHVCCVWFVMRRMKHTLH